MKNEKNEQWALETMRKIANEEQTKRQEAEELVDVLKTKLFIANVMIAKLVVLTQMIIPKEVITGTLDDIEKNHKNLTDAILKNLYDGK